jgi:transcriptional regulator with XRE-family HTH domain
MKNPFKQLRDLELEMKGLTLQHEMLHQGTFGKNSLQSQVSNLEQGMNLNGSDHPYPLIRILGAIIEYLNVDIDRGFEPDLNMLPPDRAMRPYLRLIPRLPRRPSGKKQTHAKKA